MCLKWYRVLQAQSPEFKPQSHQNKKKKFHRTIYQKELPYIHHPETPFKFDQSSLGTPFSAKDPVKDFTLLPVALILLTFMSLTF
jgi:hypothetical protein